MTVPPSPYEPSVPSSGASPYGQPSPAGAYGQPSPAGPFGQPSPAGAYGQQAPGDPHGRPSPAGPADPGKPAPGQDLGADLGSALKFAGDSLLRNWVPFLIAGLIYSAIATVLVLAGIVGGFFATLPMMEDMGPTDEPGVGAVLVLYAIVLGAMLLTVPFMLLWQSGTARASEVILDGGRPRIGQALVGPLRIILTALLVGVITFVGFLLFYIPGLIASVMLMFAIPAAARGASPVAAIKESAALVRANLATAIITYLVISAIGSIAGMFVITIIALIPFLILFEIGMFERLNGRRLPEPAKA